MATSEKTRKGYMIAIILGTPAGRYFEVSFKLSAMAHYFRKAPAVDEVTAVETLHSKAYPSLQEKTWMY